MATSFTSAGLTPEVVAEFFLAFGNDTGEPITNLRLQKLVYYAQAWSLALRKKSLFDEDFEAWIHGAVIPKLYKKYKINGPMPIELKISLKEIEKKLSKQNYDFLIEVANAYMRFGAYELELMNHQESPWIRARNGIKSNASCNEIISKESMLKFYAEKK